jgi:pimeloyl-ACP methyl ester carboxylesterase
MEKMNVEKPGIKTAGAGKPAGTERPVIKPIVLISGWPGARRGWGPITRKLKGE